MLKHVNAKFRQIRSSVFATVSAAVIALPMVVVGAHQTRAEIDRPDQPNAMQSVWIFKTVCYDPMPDTAALEKLAETYGFVPLTGAALAAFAPAATPKYLKAWDVDDHELVFKVVVSIGDMDAELGAQFPAFAKGTATGCTVVLPGTDKPTEVGSIMKQHVERDADTTYEEGPFNVALWVGQTDANVFLIYHYAPKTGQPGGLLSIVTLSK